VTDSDVQRWLDAYVAAWSSYDAAEIAALFTNDAAYRYDAFSEPLVGADAIAADWLTNKDAPGSWEADYRPFAVEGTRAVAVGETRYRGEGKRYANVYLLEFAADGRCSSFTEWYFAEKKARATA
jgi:ketosteroid isomerase-like protein